MFLIIAISHKRFLHSTPGKLQYVLWDMVASICLRSYPSDYTETRLKIKLVEAWLRGLFMYKGGGQ